MRTDPLRGFRFLIEFQGITTGGFSSIKGISREIKYESYREGGVNDYTHNLITQVSHPVLILERGLVMDDLWKWAQDTAGGKVERRTLWIRLRDETDRSAWAWQVENALPVKWSISDLDSQQSQLVVESLELAHQGLRKGTT
ncbi:phage tail protein [Gimesia aquarii]|uniref:T4-like virus tail tube protein gp19 n=1 Tax=Gimesia aquarii TaxID=2527964 RepID=A0A517VZY6_9PLAN|nr:phage tail protein [Gimesia aquarii]QDT98550.1 T4-like virus tail tube protein gp19 [Gimesia aquarii]